MQDVMQDCANVQHSVCMFFTVHQATGGNWHYIRGYIWCSKDECVGKVGTDYKYAQLEIVMLWVF